MGGHDHILHSNFVNGLLTQKSGVDFKSFTHLEIELGPFSDEKTNSILSDSGVHSQNTIIGNAQWKDLASQRFYCQRNNKQLLITVNKIEVTDSDPEDADTKSKVQGFIDQVEEEFKEPALKILRDYDTKFSTIRTRETPLIIFFAQLIANWGGFDIGLIQSGHIRRDKILTAGSILTLKDCFQIVPITDNIVGIEITGQQVIDALKRSSSRIPDLDGGFANLAGLTAVYDSAKPKADRLDVSSVKWRGKPIEVSGKYSIGCTAFLGDCGDGYSCFDPKKYTLTVEDSLDTYAIFSAFLGLPKLEWVREEFKLLQKNGGTVTDDVLFEAWGKAKKDGDEVFGEKHLGSVDSLAMLNRKA